MKNITTYYADRHSFPVRFAVLLMVVSAAARFVCWAAPGTSGAWTVILRIIFPAAVCFMLAVQLLFMSEKQFYVTRIPVVLFALIFIDRIVHLRISPVMTAVLIALCVLQTVVYCATYRGHLGSCIWALLSWIVPIGIFFADRHFRLLLNSMIRDNRPILIADCAIVFGIIFAILASRPMPPYKEGDPYRMRPGDRLDGRLVRTGNPMDRVAGFIMPHRNGADNHIEFSVECSNMERYIHQKRREGLRHFGITHVIIAAYVRCVAELPALNRFFAGQRVYNHYDVEVNMMVKKAMELGAEEECVTVHFDPADTAADVYNKFDKALNDTLAGDDGGFEKVVKLLNYVPRLLFRLVVHLLTLADYYGLLPKFLLEVSPFHGSMFITSMGSLGIPPITHHLYDFGTVPVFCAFGAKRTEHELDSEGNVITRKYVDMHWNTDERICDGHYYATVFKKLRSYIAHPEKLDVPPEVVKRDID